jgi:outer membrane protein assembly factor BamB
MQVWKLYCLDKRTGKTLWERVLYDGKPKTQRHTKASHANATPATDGKHVVVMLGSEGLHVLDVEGKLLWKKDFGKLASNSFSAPTAEWGWAGSPALHDGKVVLQVDVLGDAFLALYDLADGREIWRVARQDVPTWSSPTVHVFDQRPQILVNGYQHMGGYDFATGAELWKLGGGADIPIPTPFVAHDLVYLTNGHRGDAPVFAVRAGTAQGDISLAEGATSNQHIAWSMPRNGAFMPTPLVYGDELYLLRDGGILGVYDAKTGTEHYKDRLAPGVALAASGVAGDGKIYYASEMGDIFVVRAGTRFELLARNAMDEIIMATPAISAGTLFVRTRGQVVALAQIAESESEPATP